MRRLLVVLSVCALLVLAALRPFLWPTSEPPLSSGPVVVLGGYDERVAYGVEVVGEPSAERPLVLSYPTRRELDWFGLDCDGEVVRCIAPEPASTWGEAQEIARLARDEGWPAVTVVTSDFHLPRSRTLFRRCLDVPVHLVGSGGADPLAPRAVYEAAATVASTFWYRDC